MVKTTIDNPKTAQSLDDTEISEMITAGVHLGHTRTKRNPLMGHFVAGVKNNVEIIDLFKTREMLASACDFLKSAVSKGGVVLFVGTQPAAKRSLKEAGEAIGFPAVTDRWIGGTLTNFKVILKRIENMERLEREKAAGEFDKYTKKEKMKLEEEMVSLKKKFDGLRLLKSLPHAIFVVNVVHDDLAVREASRMGIPVVALCDTNSDPRMVAYPIPSNDDALPAIRYMVEKIKDAISEGKKGVGKKEE